MAATTSPESPRFFRNETPVSDVEEAIQETVEAYGEMSKNRVGALMVFERETNLSNIISSGTPFQSTVTSELLKNIFYPNAPLHDGAVVVRQGKIAAAACMLPMSESMNLSKDLGMRHRAGLGMSERSDAVVAIVSEETGAISVVVNGNLRRHLSPETLGRILRNELLPREESASGKRRRPSCRSGKEGEENRDQPEEKRKIFNIVLAIVLAVGVWMYVINVENPSGTGTVREIPVTVVGEDSLAERG